MGKFYLVPYLNSKYDYVSFSHIDYCSNMHEFLYNNLDLSKSLIPNPSSVNYSLTCSDILNGKKNIYNFEKIHKQITIHFSNNQIKNDVLLELNNITNNLNELLGTDCNLVNEDNLNHLLEKNKIIKSHINKYAFYESSFKSLELNDINIDFSLSCLRNLPYRTKWILSILTLFKEISDLNLLINDENLLDSFLFDKSSRLVYFVGFNFVEFNIIYLDPLSRRSKVLNHNLNMFRKFLNSFISYYYNNKKFKIYNSSPILKLCEEFWANNSNFEDFDQVISFIKKKCRFI